MVLIVLAEAVYAGLSRLPHLLAVVAEAIWRNWEEQIGSSEPWPGNDCRGYDFIDVIPPFY